MIGSNGSSSTRSRALSPTSAAIPSEAYLAKRGGFAKVVTPFSEFIRAAFLLVERDFEAAIAEALGLPRLVRARRELVSV
jgi:hypothetical protein